MTKGMISQLEKKILVEPASATRSFGGYNLSEFKERDHTSYTPCLYMPSALQTLNNIKQLCVS